jgi:hypothetical protein
MESESVNKENTFLVCSIMLLAGIVIAGSLLLFNNASAEATPPELSKEEMIKRGEYLVRTSGCHDCHSPKIMTAQGPQPDPQRLLSGHPADLVLPAINKDATQQWILFNQDLTAAVGPWGVSFSANLTSDDTGIGSWTEEQFFRALREGKYKGLEGSRMLLPPMPWPMVGSMNDDDLRAIFYYLKSTKAVRNIVPAPIAPNDIP